MAAGFQQTAVAGLADRLLEVARATKAKSVMLSGGVAANAHWARKSFARPTCLSGGPVRASAPTTES